MLITVGSVTDATRLANVLEREYNTTAAVVHTPSAIKRGGCSYAVRIDERFADKAYDAVKTSKIPIRRYYSEMISRGRRVYRALP